MLIKTSYSAQQGMSLIGLMIGMLLSIVTVLAAMSMYKSLVSTAIDTKLDAQHDGQLASAMLTLQLELQSAGFGIDGATVANHLVDADSQQSLYWRSQPAPASGVYSCTGVEYVTTATESTLTLVESAGCNDTDALSSLTWTPKAVLAEFKINADVGLATPVTMTFDATTGTCFPFGQGVAAVYGVVNVVAQSAASRATANTITPSSYSFCLPNLSL